MKTLVLYLTASVAFLILSSLSYWQGDEKKKVEYYISPAGNDSNPGSLKKPFATLTKARDAIRSLKAGGKLISPVYVYLRGGVYELNETFLLDPDDSGNPSAQVTYCAYGDETPVLSGGKKISGKWESYKDNIMVCPIPEAVNGAWKFKQLFINGNRMVRARVPDKGYFFRIEKAEKDLGRTAMKYKEGDLVKFRDPSEVEVVILHSWNSSRLFMADINEQERIINFTGRIGPRLSTYNVTENRYYFDNAWEGLDQPGEWYLDTKAGKLYIYPLENPQSAELRAPFLNQIVKLQGNLKEGKYVEYINFEGITFAETDYVISPSGYPSCGDVGDIYAPSAITFDGTRFCSFTNNTIRNVGTYGLEVSGDGNKISGNKIYDTGSGGIITRSYGKEPNQITLNHIHDCGKEFFSAAGINVDDGGGVISNNLIHNVSHTGVYGRHWGSATQKQERRNQEQRLVIEFNEIHHVGSELNDCAGIFIRDSNIVINNNLIHDVYSRYYYENDYTYNNYGVPGWGIYLGCETRYSRVVNNIIYNTTEGINFWHGTRFIVAENNIIVNSDFRHIRFDSSKGFEMPGNQFIRNIVYISQPYSEYVHCHSQITFPEVSDYNVIYQPGRKMPIAWVVMPEGKHGNISEWIDKGYEKNSLFEDPQFRNPSAYDFSLLPTSPAFKIGFKPIDMSKVGLRGK